MTREYLRVPTVGGSHLHVCVLRPDGPPRAAAVFSHGFAVDGVESGRHFLTLASDLAKRGIAGYLFDYRGSGYSDGKFEEMTFDSEVADLNSVIDLSKSQQGGVPIVVWGESFGAAVAAHTICQRRDVSLVVLWSLSAELHRRYVERFGEQIARQGFAYASGNRVTSGFLDSLLGLDTYEAIGMIEGPTLLVHGDADDVASHELSIRAHEAAPNTTSLAIIPEGNHGFEAQDAQFDRARQVSLEWLEANLPRA